MPRLNGRGDLLLGLAGVQSSICGINLPLLGGSQWLTDDLVIGQSLDASKVLAVQRDGSHPQDFAPHGASEIVAGGGRWQAVLKTSPKTTCFGSLGDKPGASVYAASPDGTIAWKPDYQAAGGMMLTDPSGHDVPVPDANPLDVQVLGPGQAIWIEPGNVVRAVGVSVPSLVLHPSRLRVAMLNGVRWCVYGMNEIGLVAQPDGDPNGYVLERSPDAFSHECRVVNGQLVIGWSKTLGEAPGDGISIVLDLSKPRMDLRALVNAPPPQQPPVQQPTPPEPTPVSFTNHLDVVQRERAKFPQTTLTDEQCFIVTNSVASDPAVKADGWGLTKAPAGGSGFVVNGQNYRLDKLCHPSGFINDILSDTPGAAGAQWGPNADANGNPSNWAPAVDLGAPQPPQPPIPPQPPVPSVDPAAFAALLQRVANAESRISALEGEKPEMPDLSQFAKHGDPVEVSGHVNTYGLRSSDATWEGKIK